MRTTATRNCNMPAGDFTGGSAAESARMRLQTIQFLFERLRWFDDQIASLEREKARILAHVSELQGMGGASSASVPEALAALQSARGEGGGSLIRQKRDWYFALRALVEKKVLGIDDYTPFIAYLRLAGVHEVQIPTRQCLCNEAVRFGNLGRKRIDWIPNKHSAPHFERVLAIFDFVAASL